MSSQRTIELLSPAKNLQFGKEAINHGADAVYIGAPSFGARASAGNPIEDIEALVKYAHLYAAKVHVALNTSLFDDELEEANRLVHQFYNIGVDAVIIQDPGLLETDLPPIALHASTQMNNYSLERIRFLENVGFQRIILARELSLEQIAEIRANTTAELECFVQGALCVSLSGQCYLSQYINGRSGNRGVCSQPCRSSYNLYNTENKLLVANQHLLSLKDFNASQYIAEYVKSGVCSFKIEGRLKDLGYVKNLTAYYRQLIDNLLEGRDDVCKSSSGSCVFSFTPDVERTFNRGFTDYFLKERKPMASLTTQKSIGRRLGKVALVEQKFLVCRTSLPVTA
ncbi:MAG: U32 family peptidase, partial [Bacteroidales bacterium]|nr:U32 family peptidase [Bacteroidales bacterium]